MGSISKAHLGAVDVHVVWVLLAFAQLGPILKIAVKSKQKHLNLIKMLLLPYLAIDVIVITFVLALIARYRTANQHPNMQKSV